MSIWNRIIVDGALFISAVVFPWWLAVFLSFYLFFKFDNYYELVFLGLFFDILYGIDTGGFGSGLPILLMVGFLLFIILNILKKKLRAYV